MPANRKFLGQSLAMGAMLVAFATVILISLGGLD